MFNLTSNNKEKIAINSKISGPISYGLLKDKINFLEKYIAKKSLILIITKNSIAPIISYIFSANNNHVAILIDLKTSKEEINKIINIYEPNYIFAPNYLNLNLKFDNYEIIKYFFDYIIIKNQKVTEHKFHKDLFLLLPTSGSMGSSKFVRLSKKNLLANAKSIIKYLNIKSIDKAITTMPFSYSFMLSIINTHLLSSASIFVTENSILQNEFWKEFKNNKITSLSGVPYIFEIILKLGLQNIYTPSLKYLAQAGGKMNDENIKRIIEFSSKNNIKFFMMYGQTEASARMTFLDWRLSEKKIGSIGKSIPNTKIWLEDKKKKNINNPYKIGEIIFKGKNVSLGYCEKKYDLRLGNLNKSVLRTGDLAYFDDERFLFLVGRKNRISKIFGNRINLDELENKMKLKKFEIACKEINEKINIYFDNNLNKRKLTERLTEVTGLNQNGFKLIKIKKIPRTSSGKISYSKLDEIINDRL